MADCQCHPEKLTCARHAGRVTFRIMFEYLFLSLSHSDIEASNQLSQKLEAAGHKVWIGPGAGGDAQQQRQTDFAIERSDALILCLSPQALEQEQIGRELAVAQAADKPIFLVKLQPDTLPPDMESELAGRPLVDLSDDFDAGLEALLALLSGDEGGAAAAAEDGEVLGGDDYGEIDALPGEAELWSEAGYYWFKKWKTLVRILVTLTGRRLIFFWDSRDIWKWKPREADELEEAFPMAIPLDQITAVGDVYRPKTFLVFSAAKPYVEIEAGDGQRHRFTLQENFESRIDALRDATTSRDTDN